MIFLILVILAAFYMAYSLGGNDAANAMATSVGSKAINYKEAVIIAAVANLLGALLVGGHVSLTIGKGIVSPDFFHLHTQRFIIGMFASLISAGLWVQVATHLGLPISTTHAIVGAVIGFGIFAGGFSFVKWWKVVKIVLSWLTSPLLGGLIAFWVFRFIRNFILESDEPQRAAKKYGPIFSGFVFFIIVLSIIYKGLHLKMPLTRSLMLSFTGGFLGYLITWAFVKRMKKRNRKFEEVEWLFAILQILTATYMGFAHGANDVANAIGPAAGVWSIIKKGTISGETIPLWILSIGGIGLALGTALFGYKVIKTLGEDVTEITPTRGFSAEFGAATTVLIFSKLGIPISTTHTVVGAIIGIGFARGMSALNIAVIRNILISWILTLPLTGITSGILYWMLKTIFRV
jgi:PiT family inorganic phosphate transporter